MTPARRSRESAVEELLSLRARLFDGAETERVGLDRLDGRVLATAVTADRDVPPQGQATMDGFAVASDDRGPREIRDDRSGPGDDPVDHRPGTATRVATGGPVPRGADAVLPVEDAEIDDGAVVDGSVPAGHSVSAGQHVIARGSVVAAGETVLAAGRRLAPRDAVVLRELGIDDVPVRRRLSTAVLATGTEIHEGREPDRDSEFLANLLRTWGSDPTLAGSVPDDPGRVGDRIVSLADDHDVVVTTGGTGLSGADETGGVLRDRAEVRIEGVAIRPGSRASVAWLDDESTVVGSLPGVPGAAFASATVLLRPLFVGPAPVPSVEATMTRDLPVPDSDHEFVVPVEFVGESRSNTDADDDPRSAAGDVDSRSVGQSGHPGPSIGHSGRSGPPVVPADRSGPSVVPFGHPTSSVELFDGRFRPHRVASCVRLSAADGFVLARHDLSAGDSVDVVPYEAVES